MPTEENAEVVEENVAVENEVDSFEETDEESTEDTPTVEELQSQNDKLYARLKKLEKVAKEPTVSTEATKEDTPKGDDEFRPRVEFLLENRKLNAEEYDHLAAVALRNSGKIDLDSLREAKESEAEYISFLRKKVENKRKSPGSTSSSATARLEKTAEEIGNMTPAEHQRYDEQMMRAQNQGI